MSIYGGKYETPVMGTTGSTMQSIGSGLGAIPSPYTKAAGFIVNTIGGLIGGEEEKTYQGKLTKYNSLVQSDTQAANGEVATKALAAQTNNEEANQRVVEGTLSSVTNKNVYDKTPFMQTNTGLINNRIV